MYGPEVAADRLAARLRDRLPGQLAALADDLDAADGDLPPPALIEPHDRMRPLGIEEWPAVFVVVTGVAGVRSARRDDAGEAFAVRYPFRVYLWLRHESDTAVDLLRKRYVLAVREVLFARRALLAAELAANRTYLPDAAAGPYVDPLALREDYAPLALDDAGRTIAAAYLEAELLAAELVAAPPSLGTVDEGLVAAAADTAGIPPHPAL